MADLKVYMASVAKLTEETLERLLPAEKTYTGSIHALMRYSIFAGGKRVRPTLVMAAPVLRAPSERLFGAEIVGRHHDPFTVMQQFAGAPLERHGGS